MVKSHLPKPARTGRLNGEIRDREKVMKGITEKRFCYTNWLPVVSQLHQTTQCIRWINSK